MSAVPEALSLESWPRVRLAEVSQREARLWQRNASFNLMKKMTVTLRTGVPVHLFLAARGAAPCIPQAACNRTLRCAGIDRLGNVCMASTRIFRPQ